MADLPGIERQPIWGENKGFNISEDPHQRKSTLEGSPGLKPIT
jgi:hypothetical protein